MPQARSRLRTGLITLSVLAAGLLALQFVRPPLDNPPVTAELQAPPEIKQILRNSCYSCHSNETQLPWFDQVVPAYWLVAHDVKEAREHLNFSEIGKLPAAQQRGLLFEAVNQIQMDAMPLPSYRKVHPHAALTPEQLQTLRSYLLASAKPVANDPAAKTTADTQYTNWLKQTTPPTPKPEWNGVAFLPDYKNWKAISSTDRYDNHTMREILGNDIAVKAIAEGHINPWPDGTAFAKVAWFQTPPDEHGEVHPGAFQQVEFMIRDSNKYASTQGWGWGRWRGTDLAPYGKDARFQNECISCHKPVAKNDYVYTMPLGGQQ